MAIVNPFSPTIVESDVFDPAVALDRACDDLDLLAELAELFAENRDRLLEELNTAIEQDDALGVDHAAHALKGSIGTFTMLRPYRLARELELCGKERCLEATPQLLAALKTSLIELQAAVAAFLSSQK